MMTRPASPFISLVINRWGETPSSPNEIRASTLLPAGEASERNQNPFPLITLDTLNHQVNCQEAEPLTKSGELVGRIDDRPYKGRVHNIRWS
jgi:hypothetical protein